VKTAEQSEPRKPDPFACPESKLAFRVAKEAICEMGRSNGGTPKSYTTISLPLFYSTETLGMHYFDSFIVCCCNF